MVHTLSRPSDKKESNITQEDLVVTSLRFDPDIICIGEMRDSEASSAIEASSTDHTVVTTVHGDGGRRAHRRIAFLAQKAEAKNEVGILMEQAALAFPIVVFVHKRVRKYGAFITGITQNVEDLLQSHTARTMLANSELVVMLNQAATDRAELADLMGISDLQMSYITGVEAGHGLVKIGSALVPFVNRVPKDTMLFQLMNTKPGEA